MAALIEAINVKRRTLFEFENTPFFCLEAEVSSPTARGGQTLVRLKMRNLLTSAVFEKTFKASDKFKDPELQSVPASYLYSDGDGFHFLDQESFETLTLTGAMVGDALDFLCDLGLDDARQIRHAVHTVDALAERPVDLVLVCIHVEVHLLVRMAAEVVGWDIARNHDHGDGIERGVGHKAESLDKQPSGPSPRVNEQPKQDQEDAGACERVTLQKHRALFRANMSSTAPTPESRRKSWPR